MQLVSPVLPIGSYAYSQGLEYAVSAGWVHDETTALDWIGGLMEHSLVNLDLPVFSRMYAGWKTRKRKAVMYWNDYLLASRESRELYEEDLQLGLAMARLLRDLEIAKTEIEDGRFCFLTLFALAAVKWNIELEPAACGFFWMWGENQVVNAVKFIPLGQTAGQKMLLTLGDRIPHWVQKSLALEAADIGFMAPGQVMASTLHETLYSRLFRS